MNRANELLKVVYDFYAPTEAQFKMTKALTEMEAENEPDEAIAVTLAEALLDGLQYGNWTQSSTESPSDAPQP